MAVLTRKDLIVRMSNQLGATHAAIGQFLDCFAVEVFQALAQGDQVPVLGLGKFEVRATRARIGRNPLEPEVTVPIPEQCVVRFRPSRELKRIVARLPVSTVREDQREEDS